jgi:hypothetical protein
MQLVLALDGQLRSDSNHESRLERRSHISGEKIKGNQEVYLSV